MSACPGRGGSVSVLPPGPKMPISAFVLSRPFYIYFFRVGNVGNEKICGRAGGEMGRKWLELPPAEEVSLLSGVL